MRAEFEVHRLNATGLKKATDIAMAFSTLLDNLESIAGPEGRDIALVKTKLQEASFFAKRAIATKLENQL